MKETGSTNETADRAENVEPRLKFQNHTEL